MKEYRRSLAKWREYKKYIVPGSVTISKDPRLYTFGAYPVFLARGKGAVVEDVDGNRYIDYQGALGATILGVSYPRVNAAIKRQLEKGTLFSFAQDLQIGLAKRICRLIPCAERVRFLKTGSDATSAAVRIARAYTNRTAVACCHFHGWHDWYYVTTGMNRGIPQSLKKDVYPFAYNDLPSLKKIFREHKIAAVIMEATHTDPPRGEFLQKVRDLAHKNGALLIFDEVVTGFRFSLGGAQKYFGVTPDLCTLAKALGNGTSISAVAGRKEVMDSTADVITSSTYGEETLPMAAAIATIDELASKPVLKHIWGLGERFQKGFNSLAALGDLPISCIGYAPRMEISFADVQGYSRRELKAFFLQETARRGILFGMHIFINYSHTRAQIDKTLAVCREVLADLSRLTAAQSKLPLEGELPVELW